MSFNEDALFSSTQDDEWANVFDILEFKNFDDDNVFNEEASEDHIADIPAKTSTPFADNMAPITLPKLESSQSFSQTQIHRRTTSSPLLFLSSPQPELVKTPFMIPATQSTMDYNTIYQRKLAQMMNQPDPQTLAKEEAIFNAALRDPTLFVSPLQLGFIPQSNWQNRFYSFGELVTDFFQRKNHTYCRFSFKLFNALKLSQYCETYAILVGVRWLNDNILRVDKRAFARLLGIKSIDGSLFHQQGNFSSHGFVEIPAEDVAKICPDVPLAGIDYDAVRILYHADHVFTRNCTESDIENCRWTNSRK